MRALSLLLILSLLGCSAPQKRSNHNSYGFQQQQAAEAQRQLENEQ